MAGVLIVCVLANKLGVLVSTYDRSESRCSRTSVNTIDDVQQHFDVAIAAGEKQISHEQGLLVQLLTVLIRH